MKAKKKNANAIQTPDSMNFVKKLNMTQICMKLKIKLLIMIMKIILLFKNLIS